MQEKSRGFTLIELLISVAIVGILAAIAYPSYMTFIAESNRSEGQRELLKVANLMEQFFLDNRTYTQNMTQLGLAGDPFITELGNYSIDSVNADADGYTLIATAIGNQATSDITACLALSVSHTGKKSPTSPVNCWE